MAAKKQAETKRRFAEAEESLRSLRRAERNPNLADGAAEFQANLVSFIALSQSCVTMPRLSDLVIDEIITKFAPDEIDVFRWFRRLRNESLKEGTSVLKTRVEMVPYHEYVMRYPPRLDWHPAYHPVQATLPGSSPIQYGVNIHELEFNGLLRPAVETCRHYLDLVQRFLQDPAVFGSGF